MYLQRISNQNQGSGSNRLLFTTAEAAEMLGLSESTVQRLRRSGELKCVVCGRCVRFTMEAIQAFIAASSMSFLIRRAA